MKLEDLQAPPASPEFHSELRRRIDTGERLARGRRRAAALVAVVAALVIVSATSVSAFREQTKPIDRTYSCSVPEQGGVNRVDLVLQVKGPPFSFGGKRVPRVAEAIVNTGTVGNVGSLTDFGGVTSARGGYGVNEQVCTPAAAIPLIRGTLPLLAEVRGTKGDEVEKECWLASTIRMRIHTTFKNGAPITAQIAVRSGAKLHPTAFIDWTPTHSRLYASAACNN
jgi:hypothetical protein